MNDIALWAVMLGIGLATFIIRVAPMALIARAEPPDWLKRALRYVPPAVMTAIITPALFFAGGGHNIAMDMPRLGAAAFAALVAWRTRSTLWTVVIGMFALWGLQALIR